jgi:hypothetical protein
MVPPAASETVQVTEVLLDPVTVAVKVWVPPVVRLAVRGAMVTATVG